MRRGSGANNKIVESEGSRCRNLGFEKGIEERVCYSWVLRESLINVSVSSLLVTLHKTGIYRPQLEAASLTLSPPRSLSCLVSFGSRYSTDNEIDDDLLMAV